ncbi:MAG: IPT/TIG domain-containing protein [Parcubacteria group bacterium]|nr:IPT/TIG domain-containing protein [Parcubacteria group bacterium]
MTKKIKNLIIFTCLVTAIFAAAHFAVAAGLDVGLDKAAGTGLSAVNDPRVIAAKIIRIALGFLGLIAVSLIIYAGWLWMTAEGQEEKIAKAKKVLIGAVIGLLIAVSAFAIASFILSKLIGATTGGGDGTVCDPPCGNGQFCCNSSCSSSPCGGPPGGDFFNIRSTIPRNLDTGVIRNAIIKVFFNKTIGDTVNQAILDNNFKVEKIAVIDPATEAETDFGPELVAGMVGLAPNREEINFKSGAACGNEANTPNCLPEWSKFRVTVNGASGLVSVNGQSLNCSLGANCQFVFSTSNVIDASGPRSGILSAQICRDDGALASIPNANLVNGWARDDIGVADLRFCSLKQGETENCFPDSVKTGGLSQTYLSHSYKYDTSSYQVGDNYIFRVKASDAAAQIGNAEFTTTIRAGHCCNGVKDSNETDVDCGGECGACEGAACANDMSAPAVCSDNLCASQTCSSNGSTAASCAQAGYAAGTESCCLCQRPPIITGLSPLGGFCADDINKACLTDNDCGPVIKCDINTSNGAVGNFFTISGRYFGASPGKVYTFDGAAGWVEAKLANDAAAGNAQCGNKVWSDSQIIAIVPTGAKTGAVKVEVAGGLDTTSNKTGVPDFKINTIDRPGLCLLNPDQGKQDDIINYNGIKLSAASPYFGNLESKVAGVEPVFNNKDGTAKVPNIAAGRTTSFVIKGKVISNFLNFTKQAEVDKGPFITSFEPHEGAVGQYVTINGRGFGNTRGLVYFGGIDGQAASFDFPQICADSIWSDKQVIIKVPTGLANGHYRITMKIGAWPAIDTTAIQPAVDFEADDSLPLKPSLCKINPIIGQANSQINLYGEYFGQQDSNSKVRFQLNKDQTVFTYWAKDDDPKITGFKSDKIIAKVPVEAITGPVRVVKNNPELVGNGLNFTVGACEKTADCGAGSLCCSAGTPYAGQCKTGVVEQDVCFLEIKACVYEWNFSTAGSVCSVNQRQCGLSCCNTGDSCDAGYDNGTGKCDDIICAPGVITCGSQCCPGAISCDIETGACPGQCAAGQTRCNIPSSPIGAPQFNCCSRGQCNELTGQCDSCPVDKPDQCGNGGCCSSVANCKDTDNNPATPTQCADPLSCASYGNQCSDSYLCPNSPGKCSVKPGGPVDTGIKCSDDVCQELAGCQGNDGSNLCSYSLTLNRCKKISDTCDLAQVINDINGRQVALKCGLVDSKNVWYYESKQTCVSGYSKSIDKNKCLGADCTACDNGFACVAENEAGICVVDMNICPADSSCDNGKCLKIIQSNCECCCNKTENTVSGSNPACCTGLSCQSTCGAGGNFGLCTGCTVAGDQAAANAKCNCTGASGKFCDMAGAGGLGTCLDCASLTNAQACSDQGKDSCCVDAQYGNTCRAGAGQKGIGVSGSPDYNYCAYYQCQIINVSAVCGGPIASSTSPTYKTETDCNEQCEPPPQFGQQCSTYGSIKGEKTAGKSCNISQCAGFSCLNDNGSGPTAPNACGTCCCDPNAAVDQCKAISSNLSCYKDKGSCSGANRGLCCGCSKDNECGDGNIGCGGDTCCQARPRVVETTPTDGDGNDGEHKVCRNSLIKAVFNQAMQINSFNTNIIVVGDYKLEACPADTEYLTAIYRPNIFVRIKFWLAKIPVVNKLFISEVRALTGNYCSVIGKVSGLIKTDASGAKTTDLEFRPQKALEANRKYYVIIKGDSDVADAVSNGVLSQAGIGMKAEGYNEENPAIFNGLAFANAKVWSFTTMGENEVNKGICTIDKVVVNPSSYVFQTNEDNNRDNNQADKTTFNTITDSDLVFSAQAYASNGQLLTATADYNWSWTWTSDNEAVAKVEKLAEPEPFRAMVTAQKKVVDDKTEITAMAKFSDIEKAGSAKVYVFLCKNIWPPLKNDIGGNLIWESWRDAPNNCTIPADNCSDNNFELYYCRDAGGLGTADDLPAILSDTAVIRGFSAEPDILKEFYFFREELPDTAGINLATTTNDTIKQGGKAGLVWQAITVPDGQTLDKYLVYYGVKSKNYTELAAVATVGTIDNPFIISNLINGVKYYFAVTAKYKSGAESGYSNQTNFIPADKWPPFKPVLSGVSMATSTASLSWPDNQDDTAFYKIYYGAISGFLGASVSLDKNKCVDEKCELKINNLNSGTTYYFAVSAIDGYNNESNKSSEINLIIK